MSKPMFNKEESAARLKEITTLPAMSAERHASTLRARAGHRRMGERGREQFEHRRADAHRFS